MKNFRNIVATTAAAADAQVESGRRCPGRGEGSNRDLSHKSGCPNSSNLQLWDRSETKILRPDLRSFRDF